MGFGSGAVEMLVIGGQRVLVTGHTGFKGAWLCLLLHRLGAEIHGLALDPPPGPGLFAAAGIAGLLASDHRCDIRDPAATTAAVRRADPELVLHLAAQPLVRRSYREPVTTFASNILGTAHVLDAALAVPGLRAVVVVTTDKVYENAERGRSFREDDPLGGHDPYSASKAAAEIVTASWRASFAGRRDPPVALATARAGNVIGGGDWAEDRLLPDCLRAFAAGRPLVLRRPAAVRPWQHVLEPLAGYLALAGRLLQGDGTTWAEGWNFGPDDGDDLTVGEVARLAAAAWGAGAAIEHRPDPADPPEAGVLRLDTAKARARLGWRPRWRLPRAVAETVAWHRRVAAGEDARAVCEAQLDAYLGTPTP